MSIQKKSLISTLKTTKKANVAKEELEGVSTSSVKSPARLTSAKGNTRMPARVMSAKASVKQPARVMSVKTPTRMLKSPGTGAGTK
jgi:hypothetical protein